MDTLEWHRSMTRIGPTDEALQWQRPSRGILEALRVASIVDHQLVPWGSNYTFAVALEMPGQESSAVGIYKPSQGEAPLWDFDAGTLYRREYASFLLSRFLGWHFIPPMVIRDGPYGVGTLQLYVEPGASVRDREVRRRYIAELQRIMLFDMVTNNADRKASHCFVGRHDQQLWGIDHGLTFHVNPKLRTVIWDFCGRPIDRRLFSRLRAIERRSRQVGAILSQYLQPREVEMLFTRIQQVQRLDTFPVLDPRRNIPYGW